MRATKSLSSCEAWHVEGKAQQQASAHAQHGSSASKASPRLQDDGQKARSPMPKCESLCPVRVAVKVAAVMCS